ncbi:unnamed protein product [Diamesa tonsa]
MSDSSKNIEFYVKNIEKFEQSGDKDRLLHCLKKLSAISISVQILQETGIGRTVNSVRKHDGEVGNLARKLISKWKDTVSETEGYKEDPDEFIESRSSQIKTEVKNPSDSKSKSSKSSSSSPHKSHHKHHSSSSSSSKEIKESNGSSERRKESKHHSSEKRDKNASSGQTEKSHNSSKRKHNDSLIDSKEAASDDDRGATASKHQKIDSQSSRSSKSSHKDKERHRHSDKHSEKPKGDKEKESSSSSSSKKHHSSKESSSTSPSKKEHHKKSSKSKKPVVAEEEDEQIDNSEGMGFAEALAMFDMPSTSRKKDTSSSLADKPIRLSVPAKKPHSDNREASTSMVKKTLKVLQSQPSMLQERSRLDPLPDITPLLIPDYKPMPLNSVVKDYLYSSLAGNGKPQRPEKTDKELEFESFSSKANRTKVFSGNKQQQRSDIPSLYEMCIRILQENIDFLETTGGVPFDILRPVLERAKPDQLANIEYYNPYLLEESDVLWEPHCKRKFRTKKRQENEAWREMYERCLIEDEEKLAKLTKNIKKHQETSIPVQKTKLAYVDQMVKAPRDMRRKQEIHGTNRRLIASPAARIAALKNLQPNLVIAGDARLRVAAGIRDDAEYRPARIGKIRIAPLMAKTLQAQKNVRSRFKR